MVTREDGKSVTFPEKKAEGFKIVDKSPLFEAIALNSNEKLSVVFTFVYERTKL